MDGGSAGADPARKQDLPVKKDAVENTNIKLQSRCEKCRKPGYFRLGLCLTCRPACTYCGKMVFRYHGDPYHTRCKKTGKPIDNEQVVGARVSGAITEVLRG